MDNDAYQVTGCPSPGEAFDGPGQVSDTCGYSPAGSRRGRSGEWVCCKQSGWQPEGSLGRLGLLRAVRRAAAEGALGGLGPLQTVRRAAGGVAWQTGFAASSPATRCLQLHSSVRHPLESPSVDSTHRFRTARISRRQQPGWQPGYHFSVYTHRVEETFDCVIRFRNIVTEGRQSTENSD